MEMRCYRKLLRISYKDHFTNEEIHAKIQPAIETHKDLVTNEEVCAKIQQAIGPHEDLLAIVKRCKLQWYGHVCCSSGLAETILQGTVKGRGKTRQTEEEMGRQHQGMDRPGVNQIPEGSGEERRM